MMLSVAWKVLIRGLKLYCWCKKAALSLFRWVVPIGHRSEQSCN